ncbi:hypothetical protein EDD11_006519 [Mortierella claussenii]|nr:hypothetical protein EDD11_006519 [Mortierella claussenii]
MTNSSLLEIHDICELIAAFLSPGDFFVLCSVSRHCLGIFLPHIWRHIFLTDPSQVPSFQQVLPKYGALARHVRIARWIGHKKLPLQLRQYCPNILSLAVVDRATPEENRIFVDMSSVPCSSLPMFHVLSALNLYLTSTECQQFLSSCLVSTEAGQTPWNRLKSIEITLSIQWQGNSTIYFCLEDFLRAFPKCQKLFLHGVSFAHTAESSCTKTAIFIPTPIHRPHPLRHLRLPHCCMDIPSMLKILQLLPALEDIQLGGYYQDQNIQHIFEAMPLYCPGLTSFTMLAANQLMSDDLWLSLFRSYPHLRSFYAGGSGLDDSTLTMLSRHCSGLEELSLFYSTYVTFQGVQEVVRSYPRLVMLDLTAIELSSEVFKGAMKWACTPTLRELSINRLLVNGTDHEFVRNRLGQLRYLERLTLCGSNLHMNMVLEPCQKGQEQELEHEPVLKQEQQLKKIHGGVMTTAVPSTRQPLFPRLKFIKFGSIESRMNAEQTRQFLAGMPRIQEVEMSRCFSDEAIEWLSANLSSLAPMIHT